MRVSFIAALLQLLVGLGLLNVWLMRARSSTLYRGGRAQSLRQEFAVYGLPEPAFYVVGALKVVAGIILIAGIWLPTPVRLAATVVAALMVGAIAMHLKVKDPIVRSVPAIVTLALSLAILALR